MLTSSIAVGENTPPAILGLFDKNVRLAIVRENDELKLKETAT